MARLKKHTSHYDKAVVRLAALQSIDPALDLGGGLTVAAYEAAINALRDRLVIYNQTLSLADEQLNLVQASEKTLRDLSERMLAAVAARYGKDSNEYEKAGGVRKSEKKKPAAKQKEPGG